MAMAVPANAASPITVMVACEVPVPVTFERASVGGSIEGKPDCRTRNCVALGDDATSVPARRTCRVAVMIAVSAMACQYALLRLALPRVVSTAVMTGNLTNATLSLMGLLWKRHSSSRADAERLKESLRLLVGFLVGCLVAAGAVPFLADWAWSFPLALAALAIAVR